VKKVVRVKKAVVVLGVHEVDWDVVGRVASWL